MCRMMIALSKDTVKADWLLAFEPLAVKGKLRCDMTEPGHGDGWGMVSYFRENFPQYLDREPHSASQDPEIFKKDAQTVEQEKSKIAMVHFRKISVGKPMISNTHPFLYQQWSFAHNGTIFDSDKIPLKELKPGGTTDSERFFLFLIEQLTQSKVKLSDPKAVETELKKAIAKIKKEFKYTSLTFLMSDGKNVYAYRDCDPQYSDYYTLHTTNVQGNKIISSEVLTTIKEPWAPVINETLLVLSN
jgi:predicted glutamine amidotransferase